LLFGSLFLISGYQSILFGALAKTYARLTELIPDALDGTPATRMFSLEKGILIGALSGLAGAFLLAWAVNVWRLAEFGALDYASTMRLVVPGVTLASLGFQTILFSFGMGVLLLGREE